MTDMLRWLAEVKWNLKTSHISSQAEKYITQEENALIKNNTSGKICLAALPLLRRKCVQCWLVRPKLHSVSIPGLA